jgi:hypothetical protein
MKYALIPADGEDRASSRIRVYTLQRALTSLGYEALLGHSLDSDVCFVQKAVTLETLEVVRRAKARGCVILYDVDDLGRDLWWTASHRCFYEMIDLADVVITDTAGHRDQLLCKYRVKRVEIIPDAIDYYPSGPVRLPIRERNPLRLLWFGNVENISIFEKYILDLTEIRDLEVVVTTGAKAFSHYAAKYPRITFVPWSRSSFLSTLQSCDLSCLTHDGSVLDRAKSNNKMISSITWGVPALVSRTPEYERTARDAGVETAVFSNERELQAAIERFRPRAARIAYLTRAQPDIWNRYAPCAIAAKFVEMTTRYSTNTKSQGDTEKKGKKLTAKLRRRLDFELWRFRCEDDRVGHIKSLARELGRDTYDAILCRRQRRKKVIPD